MTTQSIKEIVQKYTGVDLDTVHLPGELAAGVVEAVGSAARDLYQTEESLTSGARRLHQVAAKIEANVDAGADDLVYQLNDLGEIGNLNVDALIAKRAAQITALRRLVHLLRN
jgi:hypothetical protein